MKQTILGLLLGCSVVSGAGAGEDGKAGWRPFVVAGLTRGGDNLFTATITGSEAEQHLYAGSLLQFGAGAMWTARDLPVSIAFSANYHLDDNTGANGTAQFKRIPLEALAYYVTEDREWRAGLGVRYVWRPTVKAKITSTCTCETETVSELEYRFNNTVGIVAETGWAFGANTWLNVRAVKEIYEPRTDEDRFKVLVATGKVVEKVNGSHMGINLVYAF